MGIWSPGKADKLYCQETGASLRELGCRASECRPTRLHHFGPRAPELPQWRICQSHFWLPCRNNAYFLSFFRVLTKNIMGFRSNSLGSNSSSVTIWEKWASEHATSMPCLSRVTGTCIRHSCALSYLCGSRSHPR